MNYQHDNAEWSTTLTTGETVKIAGRTVDAGSTGRVIGLMDGDVIVLIVDRVRSFSPHDLARPDGTPHITLVSGKPKQVNRPVTRRSPEEEQVSRLRGIAKATAASAERRRRVS